MAYGKIKADTLVYDNSGSDVEVTISTLGNKADLASPTFTGTVALPTVNVTGDVLVDNQKDLRFGEADSNGANYVAFQAPASIASNVTWTLPAADGSANQFLKTDGSGALTWGTDATTDSTKMPLAGGTFTGDVVIDNQKDLRFEEATANGDHYIALQAPASVASSITFTLPAADGSAGQLLKTDGSGNLGWANDTSLSLASDQTWTGSQRGAINALSSGTTITIDMNAGNHHSVTLGHNTTFANPTNQSVGQAGSIFITQDGTGSRTAAWEANFKWKGGTAPTLTTTANAVDRVDYITLASGSIHAVATLDIK